MATMAIGTRLDGAPLQRTGVARLIALSMLARTPEAAVGLLLVLRVRDLGGSFALAGIASGVLGLGMALGAPVLGRLIDRRGQTGVLVATGLVASLALVVAGALPDGVTPAALVPLALALGISTPPIAPCLRALFGRRLHGDARHGALALDAALQEISFTAGPLVFVTALAAWSPGVGLLGAGGSLLAGTLAFAATPESREIPGEPGRRPRGGALNAVGIRTLVVAAVGTGALFGATEIGLTAAAEHEGPVALGLLLAAWSIPSLLAGLVSARLGAPADLPRALVLLIAATGVLTAGLVLMPDLLTLGALLALSGAISAPMFATLYSVAAAVAREGTVTEAYTWLGSGSFAGLAIGAGLAGAIISAAGAGAAFVAAGLAGLVAAGAVWLRDATLRGGERELDPLVA